MCESLGMRNGIHVNVSSAERTRLEAVVADRSSPQKHVWRARIILLTGDGLGTAEIMRRTGKSKPCVWRWQERFMHEGVGGLLRDKTRPSRIPPLPGAIVKRVVELTSTEPPGETPDAEADLLAISDGQAMLFEVKSSCRCMAFDPDTSLISLHLPSGSGPILRCLQ